MVRSLQTHKQKPGLSPRTYQLLKTALQQAPQATRLLSTRKGRIDARKMFVPINQLKHARELVESKIQVAALRSDEDEIHVLRLEMAELGG